MSERLPTSKERIHAAVHILCDANPKNLKGLSAAKKSKELQDIVEAALHALTCNDCMFEEDDPELRIH